MAAKRKSPAKKTAEAVEEVKEEVVTPVEEAPVVEETPVVEEKEEKIEDVKAKGLEDKEKEEIVMPSKKKSTKKDKKVEEKKEIEPKYKVGSIVYVAKDASVDLNGFKLFPQYKKYTYTVEAYDAVRGVYTLRRLNLSLRLKEDLIIAPNERAHDSINRRQF